MVELLIECGTHIANTRTAIYLIGCAVGMSTGSYGVRAYACVDVYDMTVEVNAHSE